MAVVKGPLFSIGASGTVAGSIVYSTWKGRPYVRQHAIPSNPQSVLQVSVRAMMRFLSQQWENLSAANQTTWEDRAAVTNISPFNAYVAYNMSRWGRFHSPSQDDPATEVGNPPGGQAASCVASVKSALLTVQWNAINDLWATVIYMTLDGAPAWNRTTVIRIEESADAAEHKWLITGLTTGLNYFFKYGPISDDGVLHAPIEAFGPIVPL